MNAIRRLLYNWRLYGLPRCSLGYPVCGRLMWPWQDISGNGEQPGHARCVEQGWRWLDGELTGAPLASAPPETSSTDPYLEMVRRVPR